MHKPLRWRALADLRGGHSQAFELLAGPLTRFSPRARNNFIAVLAALAFLFALAVLPTQAQATATISGPSTLHEGGLVAQQVGNCPAKQMQGPTKRGDETVSAFYTRYIAWYQANRYSRNYCEFRDIHFDPARAVPFTVKISNADVGEYLVTRDGVKINLLPETAQFVNNIQRFNLTQGETKTFNLMVVGVASYTPGDTSTNAILVLPPGSSSIAEAVARHEITIVDDDNFYYIGRRNYHPYGESWNSQPHCYEPGCAWD